MSQPSHFAFSCDGDSAKNKKFSSDNRRAKTRDSYHAFDVARDRCVRSGVLFDDDRDDGRRSSGRWRADSSRLKVEAQKVCFIRSLSKETSRFRRMPKPMAPAAAAANVILERSITAVANVDKAAAVGYVDAHRSIADDDDANRSLIAAAAPASHQALASLSLHINEPIAETPMRTQSLKPIINSTEPLPSSAEPLASDVANLPAHRRRRDSQRAPQKSTKTAESSSVKIDSRRRNR